MCSWTRWALLPLWGLPLVLCPAACWGRSTDAGTVCGACFCGDKRPGNRAGDVRRRVQSVLWGGAPAPVGLVPLPRRGGCHCVAMGARCLDRCRGRVVLLPMSARRVVGGGWACTSGAGSRRPCGSLWIMPGPGRPGWRNRAALAPARGRRCGGCDARRLRRRRRACWGSLR